MKYLFLLAFASLFSCSKDIEQSQFKMAVDSTMNVINLDSYTKDHFTIVDSEKVFSWNDSVTLNTWSQATSNNQPIVDNGVIFDGVNDALLSDSDITVTDYSFYAVVQYLGVNNGITGNKALISALSTRDWFGFQNGYVLTVNNDNTTKRTAVTGYKGNRPVIIGVRKSGDTFTFTINDRVCRQSGTASVKHSVFGRIGGIGGINGFNSNMKVKAICVSSEVFSDKKHQRIVDSLYNRYQLYDNTTADNICGFGDSNTVGVGTPSYLINLASRMNLAHCNLGISGTRFTNVIPQVNNGYDRMQSQIVTKPYTDYISFMYGTNDIASNVSPDVFYNQLNEKVASLLSQGYNPNKICLSSCPYQRDNQNASRLDAYAEKIQLVASNNGTKYFDLLSATRAVGNACLVTNVSDKVHLNTLGQSILENGVYDALMN